MLFSFGRKRREHGADASIAFATLFAMLLGVLLLLIAVVAGSEHKLHQVGLEVLKELGVVLVSVFGVSIFYEKLLAERHFATFHTNLQLMISRGETNGAVCEALGIIQLYKNRREFEAAASVTTSLNRLGKNDLYRVIGRSLIFTIYSWQNFKIMLGNGARLELCMFNPQLDDVSLSKFAGYSPLESQFAVQRVLGSLVPWLEDERPAGSCEIRFHSFPLLDSFSETKDGSEHRVVWDLNFGEGLAARHIFYLKGDGVMAMNIRHGRYDLLWRDADPVFIYAEKQIKLNDLGGQKTSVPGEIKLQAVAT